MKGIILFSILAVIISCNAKNSANETVVKNVKEEYKDLYDEIDRIRCIVLTKQTDLSEQEIGKLYSLYDKSKFLEIRVASYIHYHKDEIPGDTYDNYLGNKELYRILIMKMFSFDRSIDITLEKIDGNSIRYQTELRDIVLDSYEQYHGLECKEFYTLLVIKDTFLIELFNSYIKDDLVEASEKESVIKRVKEYYPELLD